MKGAIAGDMIGAPYEFDREFRRNKTTDFPLWSDRSQFTDDTVMSVAVAKWLMDDPNHSPETLVALLHDFGQLYPDAGYGGMFFRWLHFGLTEPYNSFGNGSAMRVSSVGWYAATIEKCLKLAEQSAAVTHNHPEGIKGAQAIAAAIFMARHNSTKEEIKDYVSENFGYNLDRTCDEIRPAYRFDETCQGSVPESIIAFLESTDYESAVRLAVSFGGDTDTQACMAGAIAEAFYGLPADIAEETMKRLPKHLSDIVTRFCNSVQQ